MNRYSLCYGTNIRDLKHLKSKDVFKVESYSHSNYELGKVEGFFKRNQLQVVNPEFIM